MTLLLELQGATGEVNVPFCLVDAICQLPESSLAIPEHCLVLLQDATDLTAMLRFEVLEGLCFWGRGTGRQGAVSVSEDQAVMVASGYQCSKL